MKNMKLIIALAVILLALGGIATWDEWKTSREESETKSKNKLTMIAPADVVEIFYSTRPQEAPEAGGSELLEVHLVKTDSTWQLKKPFEALADAGAVDNMVKAITDYNYASAVAKDRAAWKNFGLESPDQKVTLKTSGNQEETIFFGIKAPVGYNAYLATSRSGDVLMGSQHIIMAVSKTLHDLRDKSLVRIDEGQLKTLVYRTSAGVVVDLVKEEGKYRYAAGAGAEPDGAYIRDFIDDLNFVRVDRFIDTPPSELSEKFNNPEVSLQVTFENNPELNISFLSSKDKMYASLSGSPAVFELPAEFSRKILKKANDFRNRRIVDGHLMSALIGVTIDGTYYKKIEGNWYTGEEIGKAENPAEGSELPVESAHLRPFVVDLEFAKTDDFYALDQPDYAKALFQAPLHRISLDIAGEQPRKMAIELYRHELLQDKYWVRVEGARSGYLVAKSNFESISPVASTEGQPPEG